MILVNNPGTWSAVYPPLLHAQWHGLTPTDLVFPFFLFIVGTSIVFAYKSKKTNANTYRKITIRSLKLIGLGLFLGAFTLQFPFFKEFAEIRFPGVLQRIGVVFFVASLLYLHLNQKQLLFICISILIFYWLTMTFIPVNGLESTYDRAPNNLAMHLDKKIFGSHTWQVDYDPEGFLSTLPAICTSILGIFTGLLITGRNKNKAMGMISMGIILLLIGYLWSSFFPINKALWTSSFVLVTAGYANLLLALIYFLTDVKNIQFGNFFKHAGANAITIFFLSSFLAKLSFLIKVNENQTLKGWLFESVFVHDVLPMKLSSLLFALANVIFFCAIATFLYRKRIFIKV